MTVSVTEKGTVFIGLLPPSRPIIFEIQKGKKQIKVLEFIAQRIITDL
jgi:hypothetical protein